MSEAANLFQRRSFRGAKIGEQRKQLAAVSPEFRGLNAKSQDGVIAAGLSKYPGDEDYWGAFKRGASHAAGSEAHFMANALDLVPGDFGEEAITSLNLFAADMYSGENESPKDRSKMELAAEIAGGLPIQLGSAMMTMAAGGAGLARLAAKGLITRQTAHALTPSIAFGIKGAIGASDQGFLETMKAGLTEAAFGALFPLTQSFGGSDKLLRKAAGKAGRGAILGGAAYAITPQDAPLDERLGGAFTMAALGAWPKARAAIDPILRLQKKETGAEMDIRVLWEEKQNVIAELKAQTQERTEERMARDRDNDIENEAMDFDPMGNVVPDYSAAGEGLGRVPADRDAPARSGPQPKDGGLDGERTAARGTYEVQATKVGDGVKRIKTEAGDYLKELEPGKRRKKHEQHGKNYGKDREIVVQDPKIPKKIIQHTSLLRNLSRAFKANFTHGGMEGQPRGVKGYHRPGHESLSSEAPSIEHFSNAIVLRHMSDVPTHTHEIGHFLSDATPLGKAMHNNKEVWAKYYHKDAPRVKISELPDWLQELHYLSYNLRNVEEGFAEFMKHWFTNRPFLDEKAPAALLRFEAAVKKLPKAQRKAMEETRKGLHSWYDMGNLGTAISKIGPQDPRGRVKRTLGIGENGSDPGFRILSNAFDEMRQKYVDDLHGILNMVRKLGINMPDNVWETFRRLRANSRIAEMMFKEGVPVEKWEFPERADGFKGRSRMEWEGEGLQAILLDVMKERLPGKSHKEALDDFWLYAQGVQSAELIGQTYNPKTRTFQKSTVADRIARRTREKLFNMGEIKEMVALETEGHKKGFLRLMKYQEKVADFAESQGLFNASQRARWMRKQYAFSQHREMVAGKRGLGGTTDPLASTMGVHRAFGSSKNVREPFRNLTEGSTGIVMTALENRARTELADIGNIRADVAKRQGFSDIPEIETAFFRGPRPGGVKGAGSWLERVMPTDERVVLTRAQLTKALDAEFRSLYKIDNPAELKAAKEWLGLLDEGVEEISAFIGGGKPLQSDIMTIYRNGHKEYYLLKDPVLVRAVQSVNRPTQEDSIRFLTKLKSMKQAFITTEPGFWIANLIRDTLMSNIMTRTGAMHLTGALEGAYHTVWNTKTYKEAELNGLAGATLRKGWEATEKELVKKAQRDGLNMKGFTFGPVSAARALKEVGRSMEQWNRVGEYARGVRKGMGHKHSAFLGREISTDFSSQGDGGIGTAINFANQTIPFFRAMISGTDRVYRSAWRDPNGKANSAVKMGLVAGASAALWTLNEYWAENYGHLTDEDGKQYVDWKSQPSWLKASYWSLYVPGDFDNATGEPSKFHHVLIPKIWEVGLLGTWAEMAMDRIVNDPDDKELGLEAAQAALAAFNIRIPLSGEAGSAAFPLPLPAGIDIILEQWSNKVGFTGSQIVTAGMAGKLEQDQHRPGQTETMKAIGRFTGSTPVLKQVIGGGARGEVLLRGLFGHWTSMSLQLVDRVAFYDHPRVGIPVDDWPGFRRIMARPEKYSKWPTEFYGNLDSFQRFRRSMMSRAEEGDMEGVKELKGDKQVMVKMGLSLAYTRASRSLQSMHREMHRIKTGVIEPHATPQDRFHMIERIRKQRNDLMRQMVEMSNRALKRAREKDERARGQ